MKLFFKLQLAVFFYLIPYLYSSATGYHFFEHEGRVGLKDDEGHVLIPARYEALGWSDDSARPAQDLIGYLQNNLWGLISLDDKIITEAVYTRLYPTQNLFVAARKGKISRFNFLGLIDRHGKTVVPFNYASLDVAYKNIIASIKYGDGLSYGLLNFSGKTVVSFDHVGIKAIGGFYAVENDIGKMAIYSKEGNPLSDFEYDEVAEISPDHLAVKKQNLYGAFSAGGLVAPIKYKGVRFYENRLEVLPANQWFGMNDKSEVLFEYAYDDMRPLKNHYLVHMNGGKWVIDENATPLTSTEAEDLEAMERNFLAIKKAGQWGLLNNNYEEIIAPKFDSLYLEHGMLFTRNTYGMWSTYDTLGVRKTTLVYEAIGQKTAYYWPVKRKNYWGFIDQSGAEVIRSVYDHVSEFVKGKVVVGFLGEQGILDKYGGWASYPIDAKITLLSDDLYLTKKDQLTTLKSLDRGTIYFTENELIIKEGYLLEKLKNGRLWKIDFDGQIENNQTADDRFQEIRPPSEGFYPVKIDGKYGFIDSRNRIRIANRYQDVGDFKEGLAPFKLLGRWGYMDKNERIVIQPTYDEVSNFANGLSKVRKGGVYFLIDRTGKRLNMTGYEAIEPLDNGYFLTQRNGLYGIMDKYGAVRVNPKYEYLEYLNNGYIIVKKFGKYGLINDRGIDVFPMNYDHLAYNPNRKEYLAMKKSDWVKTAIR